AGTLALLLQAMGDHPHIPGASFRYQASRYAKKSALDRVAREWEAINGNAELAKLLEDMSNAFSREKKTIPQEVRDWLVERTPSNELLADLAFTLAKHDPKQL